MVTEKRQADRYIKVLDLNFFDFPYDAETKLSYKVEEEDGEKYAGKSKNIGASGLCLTSDHKLKKGQHLHLEIFLPQSRQPIHMDGEVCWCSPSVDLKAMFDAGIKLKAVEGESVQESVHMDKAHHILWSNVLESVFGTFRKLVQEKHK